MAAMTPQQRRGEPSAQLQGLMAELEQANVFARPARMKAQPAPPEPPQLPTPRAQPVARIPHTPPGSPRAAKRQKEAWLEEEMQLEQEKIDDMIEDERHRWKQEKDEEEAKQKKEEEKQREMFRHLPEEMKAAARFEVMHEFELKHKLTEDCQGHPWAVRPNARTRSYDLTDREQMRLKMEEEASRKAGAPWQERGPRQDESYKETGKPSTPCWRGQSWRTGSYGGKERYAKRGGKNQAYYDRLNKAGLLKPTRHGAVRVKTPGAW